ncbi:unnamed protein product [Urochloa decumbens]|uniref:Major facilitator superfamily (MFS) profile domain-containing protein n=1 Tax=Urochloa decumbens TaxID=240449 RepID=A0ABC8ZBU8_9POAL
MEREEDQKAQRPLLITVAGSGGGGDCQGAVPASSSSSIAVVVGSTAVAVAGSFEFGISVGYSSPCQPGIMRDFNLSIAQYSVFGSILTAGAMLGAFASGTVADRVGRRRAMAISDLLCILGYVLITFSQSVLWLDIGRLSIGCGIGFLSYLVPVYISEIAPKNLRGGFATINPLMICCGMSFAYVLGTLVTWQTLAIIGVAPCLLQLAGLVVIPESPRWLARIGHPHEFEAALQKLRGKGIDISEEAAEIKDFTEKLQHQPKSKISDLFHKEYIRALTVGVGLMVLQQFGGMNAIYFYANEIFVSVGFSSGNTGMFAMVVVQAPVTGVAVLLMDKAGRRPLLMVSAAGTCLGCVLVGLSFLAKEHHWGKDLNIVLALVGILVHTAHRLVFCITCRLQRGIPWVIMSEIFPINMKGTAGSFVTLVNWLGSWIVSYAFNFLLAWSSYGTFFFFASICGLTFVFVERLVPETKGRTLEEIQASFRK